MSAAEIQERMKGLFPDLIGLKLVEALPERVTATLIGAAPLGSRVSAECTPVHRGRTTMVWQTRISAESGKLVALVTQTQMVLPA